MGLVSVLVVANPVLGPARSLSSQEPSGNGVGLVSGSVVKLSAHLTLSPMEMVSLYVLLVLREFGRVVIGVM